MLSVGMQLDFVAGAQAINGAIQFTLPRGGVWPATVLSECVDEQFLETRVENFESRSQWWNLEWLAGAIPGKIPVSDSSP